MAIIASVMELKVWDTGNKITDLLSFLSAILQIRNKSNSCRLISFLILCFERIR